MSVNGVPTRIPGVSGSCRWEDLRLELIMEGARRSLKIIHLPTGVAVEGVGDHVSPKQLRHQLMPLLLKRLAAYARPPVRAVEA